MSQRKIYVLENNFRMRCKFILVYFLKWFNREMENITDSLNIKGYGPRIK